MPRNVSLGHRKPLYLPSQIGTSRMRVTVFTSNQPRHVALLASLCGAGYDVRAVIEPKSWLPGKDSPAMARYWREVQDAERQIFGGPTLMPCPVVCLRPGELSEAPLPDSVREADRFVVFSSSYIRGALMERLRSVALNLHVGIAPELRGSAPNMWAFHLGRPDLIGAQVQRLSDKLDAGDILREVRAPEQGDGYFLRSMRAVRLGIDALVALLASPEPWEPVRVNDPGQLVNYSRHADFTEGVADAMLARAHR